MNGISVSVASVTDASEDWAVMSLSSSSWSQCKMLHVYSVDNSVCVVDELGQENSICVM